MKRRSFLALLLAIIAGVCAGCTSAGLTKDGGGEADCAMVARYHDRSYAGTTVRVVPPQGSRVGFAVVPGCNDTGQKQDPPDEKIAVARLRGVSPDVALVVPGRDNFILVRRDIDRLPPQIRTLLHAPRCRQRDAPIRLSGPWLGILGPGGKTEVDLVPPYDVDLLASKASASRYRNAFLSARVPASLGHPLTKDDLRDSLWKGGSIDIEAGCKAGRFVAQRLTTTPPS
jgi:Family of unknown function (DUF6281)